MAAHVLLLPQSVWARNGMPAEIPCSGDTLRDALREASESFPPLAPYVIAGDGGLPRSTVVFADGVQVKDPDAAWPEPTVFRVVVPSAGG